MLGKIEGKKRSEWLRVRWLDSTTDPMDMSLSKLQVIVKDRGGLGCCSHVKKYACQCKKRRFCSWVRKILLE